MKHPFPKCWALLLALAVAMPAVAATKQPVPIATALDASVHAHMQALAGDAMRGRGSATPDEARAANYIADELKRYGIQPAGDKGGYIQVAQLSSEGPTGAKTTVNVVGMIKGSDPQLAGDVVLLTAHLDHLGVGTPVHGDAIYNGADDDASGVCAVLELARILGGGAKPKRTVLFVLFGSEELGSLGAQWFREHPPLPMKNIVANLEFEMIGRGDSAVPAHTLWLTGFERSDLGPTLAKHGARLAADPHPEQQFFMRSDNYGLAKQGIIAHTVSSYGLHTDYHQPSDEVSKIDFAHMDEAIGSMVVPVNWLVNSDFRPAWNPGGKP